MTASIYWRLPLVTISAANAREHHMARARRVKDERRTVAVEAIAQGVRGPLAEIGASGAQLEVRLTRISPRAESAPLDDDNLASGLKGTRDELAVLLGRDDGPRAGVQWSYDQRRGRPRELAVEIHVRPARPGDES